LGRVVALAGRGPQIRRAVIRPRNRQCLTHAMNPSRESTLGTIESELLESGNPPESQAQRGLVLLRLCHPTQHVLDFIGQARSQAWSASEEADDTEWRGLFRRSRRSVQAGRTIQIPAGNAQLEECRDMRGENLGLFDLRVVTGIGDQFEPRAGNAPTIGSSVVRR